MTFVLGVTSPKSIWMLTDRQLTYADGRRDIGIKQFSLGAADGNAIIAYAGLGKTRGGVEVSDWMARVLRGTRGTVEESLALIFRAAGSRLPAHLDASVSEHGFIVVAFVDGHPRLYSIQLSTDSTSAGAPQYRRYVSAAQRKWGQNSPYVVAAGSGATKFDRTQVRALRTLVRPFQEGNETEQSVARGMARINRDIHRPDGGRSVGSRCLVCWRQASGGGAHQFFDGVEPDSAPGRLTIPGVMQGFNTGSIAAVVVRLAQHQLASVDGTTDAMLPDVDALRRAVALLPSDPDDRLD